ncbi:MAG: hypothetical protein R3F09_10485 [Burkholderiaceae bacterium]|nr:hypothetical protein [Ottowia sp.]
MALQSDKSLVPDNVELTMKKFLAFLTACATSLLVSCGGGGGYAGDTGTSNALRMTPLLSGVTIPVDWSADVATISQGVKPYYVLSSSGAVGARILDDGTLRVWGNAPGTSEVSVQDSSLSQTAITMTVTVKVADLASSIGTTLTLAPRQSQSFTIYGGKGPYTVTTNNPSTATVSGSGDTFTITAGTAAGTASILVTDAYGSTLTIQVTNQVAQALSANPGTLTGLAGTNGAVSVSGGVAPYTVLASNPSIATASLSGTVISVGFVAEGEGAITVTDATGAVVSVAVTVTAPAAAPASLSAVPPTQTLGNPPASPASVTYTLVNGTGPYYATMPASALSLISIPTGTFTATSFAVTRLTGASACVATDTTVPVTVVDAASGQSATVNVLLKRDVTSTCP